jgi:hypothetical protein
MYHVALTDISGAPLDVRAELQRRMQEIARTVGSIPDDHTFWARSVDQELRVDVRGWRFFYRVDPSQHTVDVVRGIPLVIS